MTLKKEQQINTSDNTDKTNHKMEEEQKITETSGVGSDSEAHKGGASEIFDVIVKNKEKLGKTKLKEDQQRVDIILEQISTYINEQPNSVKNIFSKIKDEFCSVQTIDGKDFIFTPIRDGSILSFVRDVENPKRYKTRVFHFSGSDHQWKIVPGRRADGNFMKGDEANRLHHYVQSAKLDKRLYKAINSLPIQQESHNVYIFNYLPIPNDRENSSYETYSEEFEFQEQYQDLKDKDWKKFQQKCQRFYRIYMLFVTNANHFKDFTLNGNLYKYLKQLEGIEEFDNIRIYLEKINKNKDFIGKGRLKMFRMSSNPNLNLLSDIYDENVGRYVEKMFKIKFPENIIPDFSSENMIDRYFKQDIYSSDPDDKITIEEYRVESGSGDVLIFAMAYDSKGRVYIDNIYDPRVNMNDYGIPEKIVQMGHLVYKPEDYGSQASFGIPKKFIKESDDLTYVDISDLWGELEIIKKYKKELISRGVIKEQ